MSLINKEKLIEMLNELTWYHQNRNKDMVSGANPDDHQAWYKADDVYKIVEDLPVEQLKRRIGKWIWEVNGMDWGLGAWCCSECGSKPQTWWESDRKYNPLMCSGSSFCGNCGARMVGEQDEVD